MSDPHCNKDYIITLTISDINNFSVTFNGSTVNYVDYHLGGDQYQITIPKSQIPEAGTLIFYEGETVLETKTVLCP